MKGPWAPETRRRRPGTALLATGILLSCSIGAGNGPVPAQASAAPEATSSPGPSVGPAAATSPVSLDIVALMPAGIDGLATEIMVEHGLEHLDGLDPDDPSDALQLADIERLVEATGGTIEGLTTASAVASDGQRARIVAAARVQGVDGERLRDAFVGFLSGAMEAAVARPGRLGGKPVIILTDAGAEEDEPVYVYAVADTVWLLAVPRAAAVELLGRLP